MNDICSQGACVCADYVRISAALQSISRTLPYARALGGHGWTIACALAGSRGLSLEELTTRLGLPGSVVGRHVLALCGADIAQMFNAGDDAMHPAIVLSAFGETLVQQISGS